MVSNASDDLPEPLSPVITVRLLRGISTSMFFRLCWRAPWTEIRSSIVLVRGRRRLYPIVARVELFAQLRYKRGRSASLSDLPRKIAPRAPHPRREVAIRGDVRVPPMPSAEARAALVCAVPGRLPALSALRHVSPDAPVDARQDR